MSCHSDYWQNSKQFSKEIRSVHIYINLQLSVTYEISYKITTTSFSIIKFLLLHYNIRLVRYFCSQVLMYSIEGSLNFPAYVSLHQLCGKKKKKKKLRSSSSTFCSGPEYMNDFTGFLKSGFQLMSYVNEYTSHCHWLIRSLTSLRGMQNTKSRF